MKLASRLFTLLLLICSVAAAQNESRLHRDFRVEGEALKSCFQFSFGNLSECGQTLLMGQPMHIAIGSLAPGNGVGVGLALVEHKNFANEWRIKYDLDAAATTNNSWRAGAYMKAYRQPSGTEYRVAPLFNFYSQAISLNRVDYFGLGGNSSSASHTTFGFTEWITGVDGAFPFKIGSGGPKIAVVAEMNGRFPSVRGGTTSSLPSINKIFDESTAPGLTRQPGFFEPAVGLRLYPALFKDRIRLDYLVQLQAFIAPGDSEHSFRRFNADFRHQVPLYSWLPGNAGKKYLSSRTAAFRHNGPNDCSGSNGDNNVALKHAGQKINDAVPCPVVSITEKLEGSINLRAFISDSFVGQGSVVPFYFSPTLGGSDLNGTTMLASYPDYRFRGPDLLLFRGEFEHSLGKLPLGAYFLVDAGKVGLRRGDISIDHLHHSYSAGLTVHAGGLPMIYLLYAWGSNEGAHAIGSVSPILLGGSSRPPLF
jgi:hypothetical protein